MKSSKTHLPLYGVGPAYVCIIILLTVIAVFLGSSSFLAFGKVESLQIPLLISGIILIFFGIALWVCAVVISKIDDNIVKNELVTTGVYALVRNPIYSAFMIVCFGVLLISGNLLFLPLVLLYWLILTVLMKNTEEKWLKKQYGSEYEEYCKKVNRCWPWFSKNKNTLSEK